MGRQNVSLERASHVMRIQAPEWFMVRECPCGTCDGAYLLLMECGACHTLFVRCEETQLLFGVSVDRSNHATIAGEVIQSCLSCSSPFPEHLARASSGTIQAAGLRWRIDYQ